jgi:membrane associated rhomboid family serine protease
VPAAVWRGQIWRLLTWAVIEPDPIALIFACLFLYWFGRDLAGVWGSRRFLAVWAAIATVASIGTCLVAQIDRTAMDEAFLGGWPIACAFTVAWGLWFPDRRMLIYFFIPIRGIVIAWGTVAITVVLAVYRGWEGYLPHLFSEGAMLAWIFRGTLRRRWAEAKRGIDDRRRLAERRARQAKIKKSADYLRVVESHDHDDAPLSPELEGKIRSIVGGERPKKDDLN